MSGRKPDNELTDDEAIKRLFPREVRQQVDELIGPAEESDDEEESDTDE
jgi:hypothetical protein